MTKVINTTTDPLELQQRLRDFRRKIVKGEKVTDDELRTAIKELQNLRAASSKNIEKVATDKGKAKAKTVAKAEAKQKAMDMLGDLL